MPQYNCEITFDLSTSIEPDGVSFDSRYGPSSDAVTDLSDNSYWSSYEVESDGGSVECVVTADDEDDAERILREIAEDGDEVEDSNGFTWLVVNVNYNLDEVEWEPSVEEAIEVLSEWADSTDDERVAKAAKVVLDDHAHLGRRVSELETKVSEQGTKIDALARRLETLGFALEGDAPQS